MIKLYSGTPGSGKSYKAAEDIYKILKNGRHLVISNFDINRDYKKLHYENFIYLENIDVDIIKKLAFDFVSTKKVKSINEFENLVHIFIDECQLIFNSRDWKSNFDWVKLFSVHRHLGMQFTLIAQSDKMIDKQIRCCIEQEFKHKKVSNYNLFFWFLALPFNGKLFFQKEVYYPLQEKSFCYFFIYRKKIGGLYDTFKLFE